MAERGPFAAPFQDVRGGDAAGRQRRSPLAPFPLQRRPTLPRPSNLKPVFRRGPRELQASLFADTRKRYPPKPQTFLGTEPEWAIYWALQGPLGLTPGVDFDFQSSLLGGRIELGGVVLDFRFGERYAGLGINVQGLHWHYELGAGVQAKDQLQRIQLLRYGIQLVWIDEDHALADPEYYAREALRGIDHSRAARGV